ncbi:hypothetical protein BH09BAC5_BH09BAC5_04990 [soil metagenome]
MKQFLRAFLCLVFITSGTFSFAQSTGYVYVLDPANQAYVKHAVHTSTNHYISIGQSGAGFANHEIIYWDANFHVIWNQVFAQAAVLGWTDIIETNDGNFVAFAYNQNHTGCNIAIKLTPTGTVLWQKEYYINNTFLSSFSISKAAGNDPGFVFGGGACAASAFLIRCDGNGTILWQHEYFILGGSGVETTDCILAENDAYILGGNIGVGSQNEAWITKVDSAGNWIWTNQVNEPTYNQIPYRMIKLSTGNYAMICGYNSNPNYTQLIYYFNSTGSCIGGMKFTGPGQMEINFLDMCEVSNGKIILVSSLNDSPAKSSYMELDATGNILWQRKSTGVLPGFVNSTSYGVTKTATNNYALFGASYQDGRNIAIIDSTGAGWCNGSAAAITAGAPDPYTQATSTPIIIPPNVLEVTVSNTPTQLTISSVVSCGGVGIENLSATNSSLQVYPNPANDEISISMGEKDLLNAKVSFYNVLGEMALTQTVSSSTINISSLTTGVYFMEVVVDGERFVKRVVKE